METYDLVDALLAHQGQRHFKLGRQTSETSEIRRKPHYGIFAFEDSDAGTKAAVASGATTCQIPDLTVPSAQTRALGHHIAPSLLSAAAYVGLI